MRDDPEVRQYFPDEEMDLERWPDREFFLGVLSTLRREWVEAYVSDAVRQRDKMHLENRLNTNPIAISGRWRAKLLEHDFASR